jgi:hypothetical protein
MSRISSPALISSPAPTSHLATIPSCIASPHLGMTIGLIASLMAPLLFFLPDHLSCRPGSALLSPIASAALPARDGSRSGDARLFANIVEGAVGAERAPALQRHYLGRYALNRAFTSTGQVSPWLVHVIV